MRSFDPDDDTPYVEPDTDIGVELDADVIAVDADRAIDLLDLITDDLPNGGEQRPGQRTMVRLVAEAFTRSRHLVVEAGTGVRPGVDVGGSHLGTPEGRDLANGETECLLGYRVDQAALGRVVVGDPPEEGPTKRHHVGRRLLEVAEEPEGDRQVVDRRRPPELRRPAGGHQGATEEGILRRLASDQPEPGLEPSGQPKGEALVRSGRASPLPPGTHGDPELGRAVGDPRTGLAQAVEGPHGRRVRERDVAGLGHGCSG